MRAKKFSSIGKIVEPTKVGKSKRMINMIVVHCTATPPSWHGGAKGVDQMHLKRGWSGIGYHFLIKQDGTLEKGRWYDYQGAHAKGFNRNSIGIVYEGGLDRNMKAVKHGINENQERTLKAFLGRMNELYGKDIEILGHRDLPKVNKACPCFEVKEFLWCNNLA